MKDIEEGGRGRTFRYDTTGTWYKGNTHIHSTVSDGGKSFAELAEMYSAAGYTFLFRTDHRVASDCAGDAEEYPLLWMDGIELDGCDRRGSAFHVVCLGRFVDITRETDFETALESARAQGGLLVLAHPHWMGNSFEDALGGRFDGVEIYNHVCRWLNGKGDGAVHWNAMLRRLPNTLGFAADDAHLKPEHPGWNGGWIVVNAAGGSRGEIMGAIRAGNFYSSCGPEFRAVEFDGTVLSLRTSPVRFVRLAGPGSLGQRAGSFDGETLTEASFEVPRDWAYAYVEIEDERGRRAWTNPLFTA